MNATINGITINYAVSGGEDRPAVVLHHPLGTNLTAWDDLTGRLESDYRVIRFDARGHGASDAPDGPYDFDTLARDTIGLMDHVGVVRAHFIGVSMGGFVGQFLGLDYPARLRSLVLVSTSSNMTGARQIYDQRIKEINAKGMTKEIIEAIVLRWVACERFERRPDLVARLRRMLETTPPAGYTGWCHAIARFDITNRIARIGAPTGIIVGSADPATPPTAAEVMHRQIKGSELVEMPGVSHMLMLEEPEVFYTHVRDFLSRRGGST
jgi:3-oxoadipate enol-lactonase